MSGELHRPWREMLGAYALGQLGADERVALDAHLDGCEPCRSEAGELALVALALGAADPAHLGAAPAPPPELGDRVAARIRAARIEHRRRRLRYAVAGVMAAAIATTAAFSVAAVLRPDRQERREHEVFAFPSLPPGVRAQAFLYPPEKGTPGVEVWLEVEGLSPGATYAIWVERTSTGERVRAGTFEAVAGKTHIVLPSIVQRSDTGAVGVSSAGGDLVMRAPVT